MAMVNMKSVPEPQEEGGTMLAPGMAEHDEPAYPYGLRICLNSESLDKLGLVTLPAVGQQLKLSALVEVVGVSQNQEMDGETCRSVELQITDMELGRGERASLESRLYKVGT